MQGCAAGVHVCECVCGGVCGREGVGEESTLVVREGRGRGRVECAIVGAGAWADPVARPCAVNARTKLYSLLVSICCTLNGFNVPIDKFSTHLDRL